MPSRTCVRGNPFPRVARRDSSGDGCETHDTAARRQGQVGISHQRPSAPDPRAPGTRSAKLCFACLSAPTAGKCGRLPRRPSRAVPGPRVRGGQPGETGVRTCRLGFAQSVPRSVSERTVPQPGVGQAASRSCILAARAGPVAADLRVGRAGGSGFWVQRAGWWGWRGKIAKSANLREPYLTTFGGRGRQGRIIRIRRAWMGVSGQLGFRGRPRRESVC
jgi:hypothetical protein